MTEWTLLKETNAPHRGAIIRHYVSPNGERLHLEFSYSLSEVFCYYAPDSEADWEIWDIPWKLMKHLSLMIRDCGTNRYCIDADKVVD